MDNFKQTAEKWAEEVLAKLPRIDSEFHQEFIEFAILESDDNFEVKPVEIKDGKIVL